MSFSRRADPIISAAMAVKPSLRHEAAEVAYYRRHPRVVQALEQSGVFPKSAAGQGAGFEGFLDTDPTLRALEVHLESFNPLEALGVASKEIRHSRILAWLLDASGGHGKGTSYLEKFLGLVLKENGESREDYDFELSRIVVRCEKDRMDFTLIDEKGRFICVVENKVYSLQSERQLERYRKSVEKDYSDYARVLVLLSLQNETPEDPEYIPIDYGSVWKALFAGSSIEWTDETAKQAWALLFRDYLEFIDGSGTVNSENLLSILHFTRHELKHSHFLAWLLDPNQTHGLGDQFPRFLLGLLVERGLKLNLNKLNLSLATVRREEENTDILFISEQDQLVLLIENKIAAKESATQLDRYADHLDLYYPGYRVVHVFLDMKGATPSNKRYAAVSYADLAPFLREQLESARDIQGNSEKGRIYASAYSDLLNFKLVIKAKSKRYLPVETQTMCDELGRQHQYSGARLLAQVKIWQIAQVRDLETFLYQLADELFGKCFRFTWKEWFSIVPPELDSFSILRKTGADRAFGGRLMFYQWFAVPFGSSLTVRNPAIFFDVKLAAVKANRESVKRSLHEAAENWPVPVFNRLTHVPPGKPLPKFDILLSQKVLTFEEAVRLGPGQLRETIRNRMRCFAEGVHVEIIRFFTEQEKLLSGIL